MSSQNRSFRRKVIYGAAIALLTYPLYYFGVPATPTEPGGTGDLASGIVGLRGGGQAGNGSGPMFTWYFIGTQQELDESSKLQP